jgi:TRAP-type C4-dicarboxylate transport system permease small subunit
VHARGAAALNLAGAIAALAFAGVLAFYGVRVTARNLDVDTTTLFFTVGVVYAIVPAAALAVALHALVDAHRAIAALAGRAPA